MIGKTLGHYDILEPLGAGGMGEVYRARDTKLDRDVAIKVLPDDFASDPDRLARFEREAKLLASLNHANIATIHGFEDFDGVRFIAMELVEGETLADQLAAAGPIDIDESLEVARQLAEALEAAHGNGVIHRDLKPANIKVTPAGNVKVLDFGLAKAYEADGSASGASADVTHSPTMAAATRIGVIMGTAAYMSPEQARGKPVDKRTDIWAFGCVLYEMFGGRPAFAGETVTDILAAIVKEEPDWQALPAATPRALTRLMRRCLVKDPTRRLRDAGDARLEIEDLQAAPAEDAIPTRTPRVAPWHRALPWALALVMAVAAIGSWLTPGRGPAMTAKPVHMEISLPAGVHIAVDTEHPALALSPDGARLVIVGEESGTRQLYVRELASSDVRVIDGTEGAASPSFSPDGTWIGFLADNSLKKVPAAGGVPVAVHYVNGAAVSLGVTWNSNETVVQASSANGGLKSGSVAGDTKRTIDEWVELTDPMAPYAWPEALPSGRQVLFTDLSQGDIVDARVALLTVDSGAIRSLFAGGTNPRYSSTGHIVFARSGSLYAVPFDAGRAEIDAGEHKLVDGVLHYANGAAQFAVAAGGTLAYIAGDATPTRHELVWVDRQGQVEVLFDNGQRFLDPRLSPDGSLLAVTSYTGANSDIWLLDLERLTFDRLTSHPGEELVPVWSPDGTRLAVASEAEEDADNLGPALALMPASSAVPEVLIRSPGMGNWEFPSSWSSSGWIAYRRERSGGEASDIWLLEVGDGTEPVPFVEGPATQRAPMFSPDGRWIAYVSNASGGEEVYVEAFPDSGPRVQISTQGGTEPVWARDGRELFYREGDKLMAVDVGNGPDNPGTPEELFAGRYRTSEWGARAANYDVAPDGRFVMVRQKNPILPTVIQVVLNWPEALLGGS